MRAASLSRFAVFLSSVPKRNDLRFGDLKQVLYVGLTSPGGSSNQSYSNRIHLPPSIFKMELHHDLQRLPRGAPTSPAGCRAAANPESSAPCFLLAGWLMNHENLIGPDVPNRLNNTARPLYIQLTDLLGAAEPEMRTRIAAAKITSSRLDLGDQRTVVYSALIEAPIPSRLLLWPTSFKVSQWFPVFTVVPQQLRQTTVISYEYVHVAVVIDVAESDSSSYIRHRKQLPASFDNSSKYPP